MEDLLSDILLFQWSEGLVRIVRKSREVVEELFDAMNTEVHAYSEGAMRVSKRVAGTSFFPGGNGLWMGPEPHGDLPESYPECPLMVLGHNFDSVKGHSESCIRGVERMTKGTWKYLLLYLKESRIDPKLCVFTNVFVGLQPLAAEGRLNCTDTFKEECRAFLRTQIGIIKPSLIATLGVPAQEQLVLLGCNIPSVKLLHPGAFRFKKAQLHAGLIEHQAWRLRDALERISRAATSPI